MSEILHLADVESLLWDCVNINEYPYQTSGIEKLAALIVEQNERIAALEARVATLEGVAPPAATTQ